MQRSSLSTSSLNIGFSIGHKLFLAFTGLALVLTLGMGGMFAGHLYSSFNHYLAQAELGRLGRMVGYLELRHEREGGWGFARTPQDLFPKRPALPPTLEGNPSVPPPPPSAALSNRPADPQGIEDRIALFDAEQKWLLGAPAAKGRPLRPLYSGNRVVIGYIGLAPALTQTPPPPREAGRPPPPGGQGPAPLSLEDHFLRNQLWYLLWVLLAGFLLSASMAFLIARSARRRVGAVSTVLHAITEGNLEARTDTNSEKSRGQDELDQLATDTNRMAVKLQELEIARRRWVADTSHELRTPLTILRLHLDGLQEGVIAPSKENLAPILAAVQDLEGLVKDLQTLAMGDAMGKAVEPKLQFHPIPILALLDSLDLQYRAAFAAQGLELHILPDAATLAAQPPSCVWGDELRLRQLFTNLLSNTLRYTDAGGRAELRIRADLKHHRLLFELHDSAPSVPEGSLPRLFERFYRVDASRSRASGGSGLGLAIVRSIVQTHGGKVIAAHSDLGGLCIGFDMPLA